MLAAGEEIGIPRNEDLNGRVQEGIGWHQATIGGGRRSSTAVAYLKPVRHRVNLDIQTHAMARRVLFDGKCATGVEYDLGGTGSSSRHSPRAFAYPNIISPYVITSVPPISII